MVLINEIPNITETFQGIKNMNNINRFNVA